ncbi:MAG: DEAD/DEAH box helicase [Promethearchaeota archaeon]
MNMKYTLKGEDKMARATELTVPLKFLDPTNKIQFREYQVEIAKKCINTNSLVVIPTGLGKTIISLLVVAETLQSYPKDSKVIVLAPTRPLINQHRESFSHFLAISDDYMITLTGKNPSEQRPRLFEEHKILFYTPQTLRNDLVAKRYDLKNTCLIIFDEAHHASGDYPYGLISDTYHDQNADGTILALTASPGSSKERIDELCQLLHIDKTNVHVRTRKDEDVKSYLKPMNIFKIGVEMTELMEEARLIINRLVEERLQYLSQLGHLEKKGERLIKKVTRKDLLRLNTELVKHASSGDKSVYGAISVNAQGLILYHMLELIEQQGLDTLLTYLEKLMKEARKQNSSKANKNLAGDNRIRRIFFELKKHESEYPKALIHPKYAVLEKLLIDQLNKNPDSRILVFVKLRDSIQHITSRLEKNSLIKPSRFVGQATKSKKDKGMSQKKQLEILKAFKEGIFNILIATNVAEEGLDIAECDIVVFYDIVASEIRYIQRKGRTARQREGKVILLYTKNTNDEIYLRIALNKIQKMNDNLKISPEEINKKKPINKHKKVIDNAKEAKFEQKIVKATSKHSLASKPRSPNQENLLSYFSASKPEQLVSNTSLRTPDPEIIISKDVPGKFGLRKKLQKEGIILGLQEKGRRIDLFSEISLFIINPRAFIKESVSMSEKDLIRLRQARKLVLFVFDFEDFMEQFEGEKRLLKQKIAEWGDQNWFRTISIDVPEELVFIIKNIYTPHKK